MACVGPQLRPWTQDRTTSDVGLWSTVSDAAYPLEVMSDAHHANQMLDEALVLRNVQDPSPSSNMPPVRPMCGSTAF